MKTKWITPRTEIEAFVPDEYVAACWGVSCNWSDSNQYEKLHGYWDNGNVSHAANHCGRSSNQVIMDENEDGTADYMEERGTDGLGTLRCIIYQDASYNTLRDISTVKPGNPIFWTTTSGSRTWHHQGTVTGKDINRPNMS